MGADAAEGVIGDHLGIGRIGRRRHPDIHHPVFRREPTHILAVRADTPLRALRIAENRRARDQLDGGLFGHGVVADRGIGGRFRRIHRDRFGLILGRVVGGFFRNIAGHQCQSADA